MADLLDAANKWLTDQVVQHRSRTVVYARGAESASVLASPGRSVFRLDNGHGLYEHVELQDYLVTVAVLAAAGFGEPQAGDRIVDSGETFEVLAPGGEPHFKTDPYRRMYRIHTKRVGGSA